MKSSEITTGRTFVLAMEDGEDFFTTLRLFCDTHNLKQGYIPGFIAGFRHVKVVGTVEKVEDRNAPVWSHVYLETVEALGCGTLAVDDAGNVSPHIHVTVGMKLEGATAYTSHLLSAEVIFLSELIIVEIAAPALIRVKACDLYNVPLLSFETT